MHTRPLMFNAAPEAVNCQSVTRSGCAQRDMSLGAEHYWNSVVVQRDMSLGAAARCNEYDHHASSIMTHLLQRVTAGNSDAAF